MDTKILTFGCRLNTQESEKMAHYAEKAQLKNTIIINSCAVTSETERQIRQKVRQLKRHHPQSKIVITGCSAQIRPEVWQAMPEVNVVLGNREKMRETSYHAMRHHNSSQVLHVENILHSCALPQHETIHTAKKTRGFVAIQTGCDHRCTFCTIPMGRGYSQSTSVDHICAETHALLQQGCQEIVLTGVDLTSYNNKVSLAQMIRILLDQTPSLQRLRISSLDPAEIDEDLYNLLAFEPRIMPHIHLSIQSGDNLILKRMKRRHQREDVFNLTHRLQKDRPDIVWGADFIVGFPTENPEMFAQTVDMIKNIPITLLHIFGYSSRPNTPAARMPQNPPYIIKQRVKILQKIKQQHFGNVYQKGDQVSVLVEKNHQGYSQHFIPVKFSRNIPNNTIVQGTIIDKSDQYFLARYNEL